MQQDGAAEDGPEKEWNLLQQRWLLGKLEHLAGKYISACNFNDSSLLTQEIEKSVSILECSFYMTCKVRTEKCNFM